MICLMINAGDKNAKKDHILYLSECRRRIQWRRRKFFSKIGSAPIVTRGSELLSRIVASTQACALNTRYQIANSYIWINLLVFLSPRRYRLVLQWGEMSYSVRETRYKEIRNILSEIFLSSFIDNYNSVAIRKIT